MPFRLAPAATVTTLSKGTDDPHFLSPTPALMAKVSTADLYVENGLNLELWSEKLLDSAGNPKIRPGSPGYVKATDGMTRLEVPTELTRAKGDLHPEGNPHVWLDPLNAPTAADNIAAGLARVDPANAATYQANAKAFRQKIEEASFGADLVSFMGGDMLLLDEPTNHLDAESVEWLEHFLQRGLPLAELVVVGVRVAEGLVDLLVLDQQLPPLLEPELDVAAHVQGVVQLRLLRQVADRGALLEHGLAVVGVVHAGHDPQQGGLAGAVVADNADLGVAVEAEPGLVEDGPARGQDLLDADHLVDVGLGGHGFLARGKLPSGPRVRRPAGAPFWGRAADDAPRPLAWG